jgi:hypothetical protein
MDNPFLAAFTHNPFFFINFHFILGIKDLNAIVAVAILFIETLTLGTKDIICIINLNIGKLFGYSVTKVI